MQLTTKRLMKKCTAVIFALGLFLGTLNAKAATVDTALTHSNAMNKDIKAVVVKPKGYSAKQKYNVLYLLHGFSGNYTDWIKKVPAIQGLADQYNVLIVCPDGNFAGWYYDSPMNSEWRYETYVGTELVSWIDSHYSTIKDRKGRAITGLSMGGHGALYLAFKHQDTFGAAGSMSGAVDVRPFANAYGISQVLGKITDNPDVWEKNSVVNMVGLVKPGALSLIIDCGYNDTAMYGQNLVLHERLLEQKVPHDFIIRPGFHAWDYWANSIDYQMMFFSKFFSKAK